MSDINLAFDLIPEYKILCSLFDAQKNNIHCMVLADSVNDVLEAVKCGYSDDEIFFFPKEVSELKTVLGKCRLVATDFKILQQIDTYIENSDFSDKIVAVGLSVIPDNYSVGNTPGLTMNDLLGMVSELRKLKCVSVRGVFFSADLNNLYGKELGRYFRNCYETAKRITTLLPCIMPYICFGDCLSAIEYNQKYHFDALPEFVKAAKIVAQQNNTAFYAKLIIK